MGRVYKIMQAAQQNSEFLSDLRRIVGGKHVLTAESKTRRYRHGYRFGKGDALAVVQPGSLVEQWRVLKACIGSNKIVIMQAANTGLTGGSTPDGDGYDRDIVIINTLRMKKAMPVQDGAQVIALPGATLDQLEKMLKPLGREPHSVIGSSCIGASVLGGVANNSGGSLVQRGPAYTEHALFAHVDESGTLRLVNHLGVDLGEDPEEILTRLESGDFTPADVAPASHASDTEYADHVRDIEADTPARFNADPRRLHEASGCAGKLAVFALRLDTFPMEEQTRTYYIGTNDPSVLTRLRRGILSTFRHLPIAAEYIHRDAFDLAAVYGKDIFLTIDRFGTDAMPAFFNAKSRFDAFAERLAMPHISDRFLQAATDLFPNHLPPRMTEWRDKYEHHLLLKVGGAAIHEAEMFLPPFFDGTNGDYFTCTDEEAKKAFLHRFAVASAAVRYRAVHAKDIEGIVALDIALRRNDQDWVETLPPELDEAIALKLYYGHFFCHVFHQDYLVKKGHDLVEIEHTMWRILDERGAQYPAEHNVGHLYPAAPALHSHYRANDPCNCMNPGIGQTSKLKMWR